MYICENLCEFALITFGVDKCKLLISAKKKKYLEVLNILKEEPEVLTFYGTPVSIVEKSYTHIGVDQAPVHQSAVAIDERIKKGQVISYMMQDVTKNALLGISPLANRNVFMCYHSPTYLYGTDTFHVNKTDMERLERKYRGELKRMLALPSHTPSSIVYLMIGVLPATAMRDVDIMGLLGQVAMCTEDQQYVTDIIRNNLEDYDSSFGGWSSLVRKTAEKYSLPDPLLYMSNPWISHNWRRHCKSTIIGARDIKLRQEADSKDMLEYINTSTLTTANPHNIYKYAGLDWTPIMSENAQLKYGSYLVSITLTNFCTKWANLEPPFAQIVNVRRTFRT